MGEYNLLVREVLKDGFLLTIDESKKPHVLKYKHLSKTKFDFDTQKVIEEAKKVEWEDKQLLIFLEWGFKDYKDDKNPMCKYFLHQRRAYEKPEPFMRI